MVNLNRQIGVSQARQGGFSSHVLPAPVGYQPAPSVGLGWMWVQQEIEEGISASGDAIRYTVKAISGDGGGESQGLTIESLNYFSQTASARLHILPVHKDVFIVMLYHRFRTSGDVVGDQIWPDGAGNAAFRGFARLGFLLSRQSAQRIDIPESLAVQQLAAVEDGGGTPPSPGGVGALSYTDPAWQRTDDPFFDDISPFTDVYKSTTRAYQLRTSATLGDSSGSAEWRIDTGDASRFAAAVADIPSAIADFQGSVFWRTFKDGSDARQYLIQTRDSAEGEWRAYGAGVSTVPSAAVAAPRWGSDDDPAIGQEIGYFGPVVSIPLSDRRAWFQSEHGMTIP